MRTRIGLTLALLTLAMIGGCNIVAPIALVLEPPPSKDAATDLEKARKTVFFVDDRASRLPKRSLRGVIGRTAEETLIAKKMLIADNVIPAQSAIRVVEYESNESPMSVADIGRRLGAEIVVYITIDAWTLTRDGSSAAPSARGRVKIIDTVANERIFPAEDAGYPIMVRMPTQTGTVPTDRSARAALELELAVTLGVEVARVFFDHEIDPMSNKRL
ncbi:MAG: hypothetical protein RLN60_02485 [Phycisphaerales bacterium]